MVLNEEKKQGNKKEKLTESLYLTVKIARRKNYNIDLRNGQRKTQAADCRLQTADCGPGVNCRLSVKCRLQTEK